MNWHRVTEEEEEVQDATGCVMWFLALATSMQGFALLHVMAGSQAVHAEVIRFQNRNHLVVWLILEFWTNVKGMFVSLA